MNTKNRLNCYVFSNLVVSFMALNILTHSSTTELVKRTSSNMLNKIYEDEIIVETVSVPDIIISTESPSNVVAISNKVVQSRNSVSYTKPSYNSLTGSNLVNYARRYLGLRYVSAGNSLQTGTDCSGFTRLIYKEFGINLGRTVSSQVYSGTYVSKSDLQPGDLVFYSYGSVATHVAIYMGNGLIIHESNPRDGVKISSVNIMNYITARRLITSNIISNSNSNSNVLNNETKSEVKEEKNVEEVKENITTSADENKKTEEVVIKTEKTEEKKEETVTEQSKVTKEENILEIKTEEKVVAETQKEEETETVENKEVVSETTNKTIENSSSETIKKENNEDCE